MEIAGVQEIAASRADVWKRLNDPATLQRCIPGCERYAEVAPDTFAAVMVTAIGPFQLSFDGVVTVSDCVPHHGYRIEAKGTGVAAGWGELVASVSLADSTGGTRLTYTADARMGQFLNHMGSHLFKLAANRFAQTFFARFEALVPSQ